MPLHSFTKLIVHLILVALVDAVQASMAVFTPLSCNAALSVADCTNDNPLSSFLPASTANDNVNHTETLIPCGSCATVDTTDGSTISLPHGLNIEGMLYFPPTAHLQLETSHIFVQGILKIDPPDPIADNVVRIRMIGTESNFLKPHSENSEYCSSGAGCDVGKKAIVVAGGTLDINGLWDSDCPAWTSLRSISTDGDILGVDSRAAECWGGGGGSSTATNAGGSGGNDEILVTNSELYRGFNRHFVRTIDSTDADAGTVRITTPIDSDPTTIEIDPEMAAEVAWLTRRVVLEADLDGQDDLHGGHLMIYHTPGVAQRLEGVEIRNFGQQGNLGRYPIHFHMSDNVKGSTIRKNVIRSSNQRCIVLHGTDEVLVEDNVAYDVKGHCYVLEDGAEMENTFRGNLGAYITALSIGIGSTDNEPAVFWITNTKNHFIGNVAAGSSFAGYWAELRPVRRPSADLPKNQGLDPVRLPLYTFDNNIGHSCGDSGFRTYAPGWKNMDAKAFNGIKSYRNRMGFFIHGTCNLTLKNVYFADNSIGIFTYGNLYMRNYLVSSTIVGVPERYRQSKCAAGMTGVQFGLEDHTQIEISDTSFSGFGVMAAANGCTTSGIALKQGDNSNNYRPLHSMPVVSNLSFDTNEVYAFDMTNSEKLYDRNVYFEDLDGSMNPSGEPGFFINGVSRHMTAFLEDDACTAFPNADSYAHFCKHVCLRKLVVRTPCCNANPNEFDYKMVVRSDDDPSKMFVFSKDVQFSRTFTFELILPAGNFNIDFIDPDDENIMIPDENDIEYTLDPAPHCTNHINTDSITFNYKLTSSPTKKSSSAPIRAPTPAPTQSPTPMGPTAVPTQLTSIPTGNPSSAPTPAPTHSPTTMDPTAVPSHITNPETSSPTTGVECTQGDNDKWLNKVKNDGTVKTKTCDWLAKKSKSKKKKICKMKVSHTVEYAPPQVTCKIVCNSCDPCYENPKSKWFLKKKRNGTIVLKTCGFLARQSNTAKLCDSKTDTYGGYSGPAVHCPATCGVGSCNVNTKKIFHL